MSFLYQTYIPFLGILCIPSLLLLKQPDFGSIVTIFVTALLLFFVAGGAVWHVIGTLIAALPVGVIAIIGKAYRFKRILIFLDPWSDSQGRGYQIIQSLIAIGSGGLWGLGISNSKQKFFYLPMQHTDFIFSILAEEVGFIGVSIVILLYVLFLIFGLRIALHVSTLFARYVTLGFVFLISVQVVINLMVVAGLVPTKGMGLPFISYGGSALLSLFCMLGIIANCVRSS